MRKLIKADDFPYLHTLFSAIIIAALAFFGAPGKAGAQEEPSLAKAAVSVWPEYDRPTALVITEMLLSPNTPLPAQVVLRVPSTLEKVHTVAMGSQLDTVTDQGVEYTVASGEDWSEIKIEAPDRAIRVEYYDAALLKDGTTRTYTYIWPADYAVDDFAFVLRAPLQSSSFTSQPPLQQDVVDLDGFEYWTAQPGSLDRGEQFEASIRYERATDLPSTAILLGTQTGAVVAPSSWIDVAYRGLPYLILLLGVGLIAGGWWFWRSGAMRAASPARRRHTPREATSDDEDDDQEVHCHNCGRRAERADRFCRACGTRLRQSDA